MVMLSIATSLDALAVGLSLAALDVNILYPSLMIGVITAAMSYGAIKIGIRLGTLFGKRMEIFGGVILLCIGLRIIISPLELF